MKTIKKILSLILVTSMFLCQNSVLAIGISDIVDDVVGDEPFIVSEDVSRRGEFEKHYLCSDGTFVAVTYPEAVHYQAEDGNWVDVDNEAKYNTSVQRYVTSNNAFKVELASVTNTENLVTLRSNGHTLSWGLNTDKQTVETVLPVKGIGALIKTEETAEASLRVKSLDSVGVSGKKYITDDSSFALSKASGGITYENVVAGAPEISVDYSVFHNKIEEDIYINSKTDINSISMNVTTNGLVAVKNANGSVSFVDKNGEEQYRVGIPYMVDASDEVLNDIDVTVEQIGNSCVITYTPDEKWFHSDERVYPILLDPSITTKEYASSMIDTYVFQGNTVVHSSEQMTFVGIKKSKVYRSFFKFVNLPIIDSSMPIIGATLTLTHTSGTTTGRTVGLYKLRSDWTHDNITFGNQPATTAADRVCTCAYSSSNKYVLDLTSDVANLYSDILAGTNYGYMLRYEDESLTNPDYNTTYSSECNTASLRPVLKITYGYSLPAGLIDGGVYSFQSYASFSYLTVGGSNANKTNVIVKQTATADLTTAQQFKLDYASATGAYRLRAMSSSNGEGRVLDIVKSGGYVQDGCNVQIYDPTDVMASQWFIVGVGASTFKIIPRTNMSLALTAAPGANGSSSGTSSTSAGNVYVSTYTEGNDYQRWTIRDMSTGSIVSSGIAGATQNGVYYLNNRETGKYLYKTASSTAGGQSGLIADLGSSIRWQITHVENDKYTIQSTEDPTLFLKAEDGASAPTLSALPASSEVSDNYLWKILTASGGGTRIRNVATEQYLRSDGTTNSLESTLPSSSTNDYDYFVWRLANANTYGNTSAHSKRELSNNSNIDDITTSVGYSSRISVEPLESATILWVSEDDFTYSIENSKIAHYDASQKRFIGLSFGATTVSATHKVTGITIQFNIGVESLLIYRSRNREVYGFEDESDTTPQIEEDLQYGQKTMSQLLQTNYVQISDLYSTYNTVQFTVSERLQIIKSFCYQQIDNDITFKNIIDEMFGHFLDGTGTEYSNDNLTNAVVAHNETIKYVNSIVDLLTDYLSQNNGDIASLYYDEDLWTLIEERSNHPMVNMMSEFRYSNGNKLWQPVYGYNNGVPGLALCIDSLYGNKFSVEEYNLSGNSYSGSLRFRFYDHFGLDTLDLTANKLENSIIGGEIYAGIIPAFRQWYILQHWNDLQSDVQPVPFVTIIEFSIPFSGTIE